MFAAAALPRVLAILLLLLASCQGRRNTHRAKRDRTSEGSSSASSSEGSSSTLGFDNIFGSTTTTPIARQQAGTITYPPWGEPYNIGGEAGIDFLREAVNWDFGFDGTGHGDGLSYYIRAFDLYPGIYGNELGWGQWIGPGGEQPQGGPCALSPRLLACANLEDDYFAYAFEEFGNWANYEEEFKDCTWPEDDDRLLNCKMDNCQYDSQPIYGTFEGGMGYWPYMTEAKGVKWMGKSPIYISNTTRVRSIESVLLTIRSIHSSRISVWILQQVRYYFPAYVSPVMYLHGWFHSDIEQHSASAGWVLVRAKC